MIIINPTVKIKNYDGQEIMKNIEQAGRACYCSESNITPDSYKNFITNLIKRGHESVLEHEKVTIKMDCDIGVYKELTRHRIASYSIESTRYCNYSQEKYDNNIKFIRPVYFDNIEKSNLWADTMLFIEKQYFEMAKLGAKPDELRMLLPHSTAAQVVMTANIREWRHILQLRASKAAHPAVRQLMIPLLLYFKETMPELFTDIEYDVDFPESLYAKVQVLP